MLHNVATLLLSPTIGEERAEGMERQVPPPEVPPRQQAPLPPPPLPPSSDSDDSDEDNAAPRQTRQQIREDGFKLRELYIQALVFRMKVTLLQA